jgi:hypothetical protein
MLPVPIPDGFDLLPTVIPLLAGLDALFTHLRDASSGDRVQAALEVADEAARAQLLDALGALGEANDADSMRRRWAETGTGASRVMAALPLAPEEAVGYLEQIANDDDEAPAVRAQAVVSCLDSRGMRADGLRMVAALLCGDALAALTVMTPLGGQLATAGHQTRAALWAAVEDSPSRTGLLGAAATYLWACAKDPQVGARWSPKAPALFSPADTLPTDSDSAVPLCEAYATLLDQAATRFAHSTDTVAGCTRARDRVRAHMASLTARRRGGLSMVGQTDAGGLAVVERSNEQD